MHRRLLAAASVVAIAACQPSGDGGQHAEAVDRIEFDRSITLAPLMYAVLIPEGASAESVERASRDECTGETICAVLGWRDPEFMPRGFPLTDRELEAQVFHYRVNRNTGLDEASWTDS